MAHNMRSALLILVILTILPNSWAGILGDTCPLTTATKTDKCTALGCCITGKGATLSGGEVGGCCRNTDKTCPTGLSCCDTGATTGTAGRTCFDPATRACCRTRRATRDSAGAITIVGYSDTYNPATHHCCGDALYLTNDGTSTDNGIRKKGETCSFSDLLAKKHDDDAEKERREAARCQTDTDCKESGASCCRRAKRTGESDSSYNSDTNFGICNLGSSSSCCGKGVNVQKSHTKTSGYAAETAVTTLQESDTTPFATATHQCCAITQNRAKIGDENCPCSADSHCNGGTCCIDDSKKNSLECQASCSNGKTTTVPAGCGGVCTDSKRSCAKCGGYSKLVTAGTRSECCAPKSGGKYTTFSTVPASADDLTLVSANQNCCPAGDEDEVVVSEKQCHCWNDGDCTNGFTCCHSHDASSATDLRVAPGRCINPSFKSCCAVKGSNKRSVISADDMCCPASGGVSGYGGCSCEDDSDCPTGGSCCKDAQMTTETSAGLIFSKPKGRCIHAETQECCDNPNKREGGANVNVCWKEYQKCCSGECCSNEVQTCTKDDWSLAGFTTTSNLASYNVGHKFKEEEERCQKRMTPTIVFHAWVLPSFLTVVGLVCLVITFVSAIKVDMGRPVKTGIMVVGALAHLCLTLLLWSQYWQVSIIAMCSNIFVLGAIKTDTWWASRGGMFVAFATTILIISPYSNSFLNLTMKAGDAHFNGLQRAVLNSNRHNDQSCGNFYKWFTIQELTLDNAIEVDARLHHTSYHTWGLCSREWQEAIGVISGLYMIFQIIFAMFAFALFSRKGRDIETSKVVSSVN